MADFDLAIVGGGINGAGIARDAAGRGLRVLLVEQNDLASGTSSASTKLIHGGLRYLEHGWFRLVREALTEREVLLRMAPHLIRPMRFVLPRRAGHAAGAGCCGSACSSTTISAAASSCRRRARSICRSDPLGAPLKGRYELRLRIFRLPDRRCPPRRAQCARCRRARRRHPHAHPLRAGRARRPTGSLCSRCAAGATSRPPARWSTPPARGSASFSETRAAAGRRAAAAPRSRAATSWCARLFEHDRAYIFQTLDGRVVFALPFEHDFTLVGTTDRAFRGDPAARRRPRRGDRLSVQRGERPLPRDGRAGAMWSGRLPGVRPLYDDGSQQAAGYAARLRARRSTTSRGKAPLLTVYGGKITTYRRLAEAALDRLAPCVRRCGPAWTAGSSLPGGDFAPDGIERLVADDARRWPFLGEAHARRLVRAYGTRVERILGTAQQPRRSRAATSAPTSPAPRCATSWTHEWAQTEDDVLWRRSKLGLRFARDERARLGTLHGRRHRHCRR